MEPVEIRSDFRSKLIPASPAQLFAAMRDPNRIAKWWGPEGFTNTIHTYEFVPGGSWLLTMHGPDGKDYPIEVLNLKELILNDTYEAALSEIVRAVRSVHRQEPATTGHELVGMDRVCESLGTPPLGYAVGLPHSGEELRRTGWDELASDVRSDLDGFHMLSDCGEGVPVTPNVRAKRATTAGRQARAGENVPRTARPGLVACRWRSA